MSDTSGSNPRQPFDERTREVLADPKEQVRGKIQTFLADFDETTGGEFFDRQYKEDVLANMRAHAEANIDTIVSATPADRADWLTKFRELDFSKVIKDNDKDKPHVKIFLEMTGGGNLRTKLRKLLIDILETLERFDKRKP